MIRTGNLASRNPRRRSGTNRGTRDPAPGSPPTHPAVVGRSVGIPVFGRIGLLDFVAPTYDDTRWDRLPVPSHWQLHGYGAPAYTNEVIRSRQATPRAG